MKPATAASFARGAASLPSASSIAARSSDQRSLKSSLRTSSLELEVVVDEAVGDPRLVGDVGDAGRVEALAGEDADRRVEDLAALVDRRRFRLAIRRAPPAAAARRRRGGRRLASEGSSSRTSLLGGEVEVGGDEALPVGRGGQHPPPGVDDRRVPVGAEVGRRLADLVGGDDEDLVLDRPGAQQHLPVVAAGRRGEGRGDGDQAGAAHGEDPVELGEAQVVADGQSRARARRAAR